MARNYLKTMSGRRRLVTVTLAVILVAGLAYGGYRLYQNHYNPTITTKDGGKVKLKPATEEEKKQADDNKSAIVKRSEQLKQAAANSSGQTPSSVVITSADASGVRAYVTGVFEEGGTCTATASQGGQTFTKSSVGFQNVSYTQCSFIDWGSPLGPGTWNITVSYKSAATSSTQSTTIGVN